MHVLVGTYELLGLTNLSAQLSRRTVEVHFGRYLATVDKDRLAFKSVLLTFQRQLPVSEEPDLVGLWERLYEGSLGCVGVLKSWLNRALADAIAHEATTITRRHLDRQALPTRTWHGRLPRVRRFCAKIPKDATSFAHCSVCPYLP
jgi:hypothetical protein